jgi:pseudouridine kinase
MHSKIREDAAQRPILVIGAAGVDMVGVLNQAPRVKGANLASNRISFGGVARNVAENLARLGQPVHLLTVVGSDSPGENLIAHTRACGVDVSACQCLPDCPTASYLAVYDSEGELVMALEDMRVIGELSPSIIKQHEARFYETGLVFVDANLPPQSLKTVFQLAKKAKVPVCADATSAALSSRLIPHLEKLFLLTANSAEASVLSDGNPEVTELNSAMAAARGLVVRGVEIAIITLAKSGVCYSTQEVNGHVPALNTQVVDPTGSGDALTATVLFGLVNEIPLDDTVRLGVTAASLVLRYPGTVLPELSLERLYAELVS